MKNSDNYEIYFAIGNKRLTNTLFVITDFIKISSPLNMKL